MKRKKILLLIALFAFIKVSQGQIAELHQWLKIPSKERPTLDSLEFSKQALTKNESQKVIDLLLKDKQSIIQNNYEKQWDDRLLKYNDYTMPFYYQIFGSQPSDGRSLFISLHGGGGAPAEVNDQQYENQKHLYDNTMSSLEGVYLAIRAPTNTWDLWHQGHIDEFLNLIIQLAVIKENVNTNKVYILGYSAGGDGLYQLAPRMADRWAAASMMAGHPGDASPLNLRNLPFAIHMGALDKAYNRNEIAKRWSVILDSLQHNDPDEYIHDVQVHEGLGHWMKRLDSVALPWMKNYMRNPIPQKVIWIQDNRHHQSFYWLKVSEDKIVTGGGIIATYDPVLNEINIIENYSECLQLLVNDDMMNLNNAVTIKYQNKVIYKGILKRSIWNIYDSLSVKGDSSLTFSSMITIKNNQTVE